jgi:Na+/H+ antiporter NhaB
MFYELYIYCKVIFIICTIYIVILILKFCLTGPYLLACPRALKIIEPALSVSVAALAIFARYAVRDIQ